MRCPTWRALDAETLAIAQLLNSVQNAVPTGRGLQPPHPSELAAGERHRSSPSCCAVHLQAQLTGHQNSRNREKIWAISC